MSYLRHMNQALHDGIKKFFKDEFAAALAEKVTNGYRLADFDIHPFNVVALSSGIFGKATSKNIAMALIYPRILGTSITTTFGDKIQKMCVSILGATPSATQGMDIEFDDKISGEGLICQLKAGPNTINSGDVDPIIEKMRTAVRLLRQNRAQQMPTFAVCVAYGTHKQLSSHYIKINGSDVGSQPSVPIFIGKDFWRRLTGDENFYTDLVGIFTEVFDGEDYSVGLNVDIERLATEIESAYFTDGELDVTKL